MNTALKDKLIDRIDQLLERADAVIATERVALDLGDMKAKSVDVADYMSWLTSTESFVKRVASEDSAYYKNFQRIHQPQQVVYNVKNVAKGVGILRSLKEDLEQGLLDKTKDLARTEIFADILETAEHLLEKGEKESAAVLISTVLENGLRKIAEKKGISGINRLSLSSLSERLAKEQVYNLFMHNLIREWATVRNQAAHGQFDEYETDDVKEMLSGVRRFLIEYLV